jgi:hypothetical protein
MMRGFSHGQRDGSVGSHQVVIPTADPKILRRIHVTMPGWCGDLVFGPELPWRRKFLFPHLFGLGLGLCNTCVIGRSSNNQDVQVLIHGSMAAQVSRIHAKIEISDDGEFSITNFSQINPTLINNEKLQGTRVFSPLKDIIAIGGFTIQWLEQLTVPGLTVWSAAIIPSAILAEQERPRRQREQQHRVSPLAEGLQQQLKTAGSVPSAEPPIEVIVRLAEAENKPDGNVGPQCPHASPPEGSSITAKSVGDGGSGLGPKEHQVSSEPQNTEKGVDGIDDEEGSAPPTRMGQPEPPPA